MSGREPQGPRFERRRHLRPMLMAIVAPSRHRVFRSNTTALPLVQSNQVARSSKEMTPPKAPVGRSTSMVPMETQLARITRTRRPRTMICPMVIPIHRPEPPSVVMSVIATRHTPSKRVKASKGARASSTWTKEESVWESAVSSVLTTPKPRGKAPKSPWTTSELVLSTPALARSMPTRLTEISRTAAVTRGGRTLTIRRYQ